jgi:hypothetical protein
MFSLVYGKQNLQAKKHRPNFDPTSREKKFYLPMPHMTKFLLAPRRRRVAAPAIGDDAPSSRNLET